MSLGLRHAESVSENWWEGLSSIGGEARLLLSRGGEVVRANASTERILARDDGLARAGTA